MFLHSSIDGHLGCFHLWTTMNNAAVNSCVHIFLWIYVLRSIIAGSCGNTMHNELPGCLPKWLYHFTFPLAVYPDSDFSTSFPALLNF